MMLTRCPSCATLFRIAPDQLKARQGRVRCGQCAQVFNALDGLVDARPGTAATVADDAWPADPAPLAAAQPDQEASAKPEPALLAFEAPAAPAAAGADEANAPWEVLDDEFDEELGDDFQQAAPPATVDATSAPDHLADGELSQDEPDDFDATDDAAYQDDPAQTPVPDEPEFTLDEVAAAVADQGERTEPTWIVPSAVVPEGDTPESHSPDLNLSGLTEPPLPSHAADGAAENEAPADLWVEPGFSAAATTTSKFMEQRSLWLGLGALLGLCTVLQAAYVFRTELSAQFPDLKPGMEAACASLGCTIPLPRKVDQIGIETSDLHPDSQGRPLLTLTASLRNRAGFAQAYPNLELTLTDAEDKPLVRRVLTPREYLPVAASESSGFGANGELALQVNFDAGRVAAAGYRLYLFYP